MNEKLNEFEDEDFDSEEDGEEEHSEEWFWSAREEYNLPDYEQERYRQFVSECYDAGFPLRHYRGRYFYEGPAATTSDIQSVIRATKVPVQWDNLGRDYIVYPR